MSNKPSYFKQTSILTSRYLKTFFNDKQNLLLAILLPVLTITIVSLVASGDMYSSKAHVDHRINDGYPILAWQNVVQEKDDEFTVNDYGIDEIDGDTSAYFIFEENDYKELSNEKISITDVNDEDDVLDETEAFEIVKGKDDGIYSVYTKIKEPEKGKEYKITLSADVKNTGDKKYGKLENEYNITIGDEYEDVTDDVKKAKKTLTEYKKLPKDFDMKSYFNNNTQKLLALPNSTMHIEGKDYIVINDAQTLAYILTNKEQAPYNGKNDDWSEYNYYLNVNVDLDKYSKDILPIGTKAKPFKGTFEGNGHIIKNFKITRDENAGMFGAVSGEIRNVGIEKAEVLSNGKKAGAVAAVFTKNAKLHDCYVKDSTVEAKKGTVGAFVGAFEKSNHDSIIHSCYAMDVKIKAGGEYVGGLVGNLGAASIKACYAVADLDVKKSTDNTGLITGRVNDSENVENCFYISKSSDGDLKAIGDGSKSKDYKEYNVYSVNEEKMLEYSERLTYNHTDDDEIHGFKRDGQLYMFSETQIGLFMLMCVAIFVGICNSIQEVCKERSILKREYMTNLKLTAYVSSKLIVQGLICAVQMVLILGIFGFSVHNKDLYSSGVLFNSMWTEYFITMFLLSFAADVLALLVSSVVKSSSVASTFIPIILIVQVVFTGVLFDVGDFMEAVAAIMISKWGIAGLGISTRLNDARMKFLLDSPDLELKLGSQMTVVKDSYIASAGNLLKVWAILLAFTIVCAIICTVVLRSVKKDRR